MISYSVGSGKLPLYFSKKTTWIDNKAIDDMVLDNWPLMSDGIQHPIKEMLRIFGILMVFMMQLD